MDSNSNVKLVLGVAALDRKARSKPMRSILNRIMKISNIEICIFGDKVILDEDVENWPLCDYLVSFFSDGFPLDKAIDYVNLRKPVCINDLTMQKLLWDRRLVLSILDSIGVVTAERISVDRDGGPNIDPQLAEALQKDLGLSFPKNPHQPVVKLREDGDAIIIDGIELEKPFVEKPVNGEDHNIHIYFPMSQGGGARKLFRKVGNKSSEYYPEIQEPRYEGSFIYEKFINVDNAEDVKVYTVGPSFVHAETRKSPVVDGIVRRNTDGKEIRYITELTADEKKCATNICKAFKQNICGFDLLRYDDKAFVIDVNGWSFVKGNDYYYDKCAEILSTFCRKTAPKRPLTAVHNGSPRDKGSWKLKANATVVRHADRTPKQKIKFSFQASEKWAQPFIRLLRGATEEVILRRAEQLNYITEAADEAVKLGCNELEKLEQLRIVISKKIGLPGTKAQLKPNFNKNDGITLEKLALVFKWGGEFTHAARYQSRDLGFSFRGDAMIMNKDMLENCKIYSSSERRVLASAEIFAAAFLEDPEKRKEGKEPITHPLIVRKDLLDDSNAGKELMDFVKKKLKTLLRPGEKEKRPQFQWPKDLKGEPVEVVAEIIELMRYHRDVMRSNFETLDVDNIQTRWCCNEHPLLFKERWEKLFSDFCESTTQEKFDPSRISELYDSLKYDSLHNSIFLNTIFRPNGQQDPSDRRLHSLYGHAKALFDLIAPQEYGIEPEEKEKIGILTSLPLLKKIVNDLQEARDAEKGSFSIYFTKESHIHTLVQLVLCSGLPITMPHVPELDYVAHLTLELYERSIGSAHREKEYSIRLALSGGAHTSNVLDSQLDAKHSLNVQPRRQLTHHLDYDYAIQMLSRHFDKDWVFSTTPLEGDALYGIKPDHIEQIREVRLNGGASTPKKYLESGTDDGASTKSSNNSHSSH
ncbi:Inositol hexakisphosphate and diphosphoinositol-pentakisphosphate kinase [Wallemia ichthyophaga EXF-994]|uniref:Inositol hexakisphosphate and diphosphoinositol-pentakisphosphate kinase n=1 Tax=Wallemia ichthyophaga (strain EXF-994 / CBS 113033) TaxID=1299270 RepID=R9AAC6_WALI9|nr:Inositol hexakisphosphate and diphosphoinositol-pentakisphosphate kinase [Wallemia ichthyophaga EXF-994]EOQ99136.1 Inositol hexakisphosphate and diphosphoinositol-pentakisphosphate kinase [Wallemia ichthyophaga EXF-994]